MDKNTNNTKTHLTTGWSGSGHTVWMVVTTNADESIWLHVERFDSEAEALNWMKWT